jgi:hypothetical protein
MPKYTVCYTLKTEGAIIIQADDLDDAKGRVEKTPIADLIRDSSIDYSDIDIDDGWEECDTDQETE